MKRYLGGIIICFIVSAASAQITQDAAKQLKIYEDDDFFNIWGQGTDRGYSNGTGIGYLFMKEKKSVFLDKWILPVARGWEHQVPNAPLVNYNFTYEAMLWKPGRLLEIIRRRHREGRHHDHQRGGIYIYPGRIFQPLFRQPQPSGCRPQEISILYKSNRPRIQMPGRFYFRFLLYLRPMNQFFRAWVFWLMFILVSISFTRCANIVPPSGGPRDSLPPVLLQVTPRDSSLHFSSKKVTFIFDEYVELDNVNDKLIVSPTLKRPPVVIAKLHSVSLEIKDTLQPNTTYTFNFADAIRDINERNISQDFQYVVSTGDYLDSLQLSGHLIDAENGRVDSNVAVMLYRDLTDSIVSKEKPVYYAKTKGDGSFRFKNIAPGAYKIFALKEEDRDLQYNQPTEMIAFVQNPVVLKETNLADVNLLLFMETDSTIKPPPEPVDSADLAEQAELAKEKEKDKKLPKLTAAPSLEGGMQELPAPLKITFSLPLRNLDSARMILQEDSAYRPVAFTSTMDSTHTQLTIGYTWKEGTPYRLIIPKDAPTDTAGQQLAKADTISFKSKRVNDYATFVVTELNISDSTRAAINDSAMHYVAQLVQDKTIKYSGTLVNGKWSQRFITPGEYEVRILLDTNGNGVWDRGVYYRQPQKQPERVVVIEKVNLKAYWTVSKKINI